MNRRLIALASFALALSGSAWAADAPLREPHQRLATLEPAHARDVALTLDACGGAYDRGVIATLVRLRVPATLFVTRRWIDRNPEAVQELRAHPELFEIENHGRAHVPAVVGRRVFGMAGPRDLAGVDAEISGGALAVREMSGQPPSWYRGAGAAYDAPSEQLVERLGYRVAGFSLNADDGATLGEAAVARRLRQLRPGDIVIAHMNKPQSGTAMGLAAALPELLARGYRFVKLSEAAGVQTLAQGKSLR